MPDLKCLAVVQTTLHQEGLTAFIRCTKTEGHPGKTHRAAIRSWTDQYPGAAYLDDEPEVGPPVDECPKARVHHTRPRCPACTYTDEGAHRA